ELSGTSAVASSASGRWRIEREMTRTARVWDLESGELVGELSRGAMSGRRTFTLSDGQVQVWEPASFWRTAWRFRSSAGIVLEFRARGRVFRASGTVAIGHAVM